MERLKERSFELMVVGIMALVAIANSQEWIPVADKNYIYGILTGLIPAVPNIKAAAEKN